MSRAGIVAPNTLIGRELRNRLAERPGLLTDIRLLSDVPDEIGQLAEGGAGATFVAPLGDDAFDGLDVVSFCGAIDADRTWLARLPATAVGIVLSAGATAADGKPRVVGLDGGDLDGGIVLSPHPAAVGAAVLLARLGPLGIRAANGVALVPVSQRGQQALDDLFEQTRALLAFQAPKRAPSRVQTGFNVHLAAIDADDVARQALAALGADFPLSIQVVEAGLFHGVGLSLQVELETTVDLREIRRLLAGDARVELARKPETVSPASLAGNELLAVGELRAGAAAGSVVLWAAFDNLTFGGAHAAVALAEELLGGGRPPA